VSKRPLIAGFRPVRAEPAVPPLGLGGLVIGIVASVRGRIGVGATLVVLGSVLPFMGAIILLTYFAKPYRIASPPMVPTLKVGDRIVINPGCDAPKIGDIVVSHPAAGAEAEQQCGARHPSTQAWPRPPSARDDVNVIKRVVAGPGDRLATVDGHVVRNGRRQVEPLPSPAAGDPDATSRGRSPFRPTTGS
jgi:signal peptidase I